MYAWEFGKVCAEFGVYPAVALENENVRAAVKSNDLEKIREILATEF